MPLSSYASTLGVAERGAHTHVTWTAGFEPEDPAQQEELVQTIDELYGPGLGELKQKAEETAG